MRNYRAMAAKSVAKKRTPEVMARKAEVIRLHVECNIGVTGIQHRTGVNKSLARKWLKAAGVYKVGGRPLGVLTKRGNEIHSSYRNWQSPEMDWKDVYKWDECRHWKNHPTALVERLIVKRRQSVRNHRIRLDTNPSFKFMWYARKRVKQYARQVSCYIGSSVSRWVGCTPEQLRCHLQSQFKKGMTLENHGRVWSIDHIVPLSSAGSDEAMIAKLSHWTNLQPMFCADNISKGDNMPQQGRLLFGSPPHCRGPAATRFQCG